MRESVLEHDAAVLLRDACAWLVREGVRESGGRVRLRLAWLRLTGDGG